MIKNFLYLQYLLCMDFNGSLTFDYVSNNCFAIKSGSQIASTNRVCSNGILFDINIKNIQDYFGSLPFIWFIESNDSNAEKKLIHNNLTHKFDLSAMSINLQDIEPIKHKPNIEIKKIDLDSNDLDSSLNIWFEIVSQSFNRDKIELTKHIKYTINKASKKFTDLYLGFYDQIPVAASLIIHHNDVITLHWVCTLNEYRGKGLGSAISHVPLINAKNQGLKHALLLATESGKSLYDKIGFKEYATYKAYGN